MMKRLTILFFVLIAANLSAKENVGTGGEKQNSNQTDPYDGYRAADCSPGSSSIDLRLNNVRARILGGGDMWWDLNRTPHYEVPKDGGVSALFSGALWIGGIDETGNLKVAAMTYRQSGNDFWPGPINSNVSTDNFTCSQYDKHYKVNRKEVEDYVNDLAEGLSPNVPESMLKWPGNGDLGMGQDFFLAPFYDADGDNNYNPEAGDYPNYNLTGIQNCDGSQLFGDETVWWIFNDVGNIHTETGADPIGLQVKAQAFAFSTNDEINNMTFYSYEIQNKSSFKLNNTYFGQWIDPDLGGPNDDFVGCDVERGLGYCYNGDDFDGAGESSPGYGATPPAIGVDFFQGPLADPGDGIDNDRDGQTDEADEQIIMSKFVYYNNNFDDNGNPENATHFYNYLKGIFKNGQKMRYGGDGFNTATGPECNFMYPDDTDPDMFPLYGGWNETNGGQTAADRRFLQSAGPFTLESGAVNYVTVGAVWARASSGESAWASVQSVRDADDKAQALFDNCFRVLNGPDAPDLEVQELENELIFYLSNGVNSNNYLEQYEEFDPLIDPTETNNFDSLYRFQGYQLFQLKDESVALSDLTNPSLARLVAQSDIKDGVKQLVNYTSDQSLNALIPVEQVNGADNGVVHSYKVEKDLFATGDDRLVNHKEYYYMVVAYGYNQYKAFDSSDPSSYDGQKQPYKAGRRNVQVYKAIPHKPNPQDGGTVLNSSYGTHPKLVHVAGVGHGRELLYLDESTIESALSSSNGKPSKLMYSNEGGPVNIKVIDPKKVPEADFRFVMLDTVTSGDLEDAYWMLIDETNNDTVFAEKIIKLANEQVIGKWGLSVTVEQSSFPGDTGDETNGFLSSSISFGSDGKATPWLEGIADQDGSATADWILCGTGEDDLNPGAGTKLDPNEDYEGVLSGTISPYKLASRSDIGPVWNNAPSLALNKLEDISSVDIVLTSDKSKWSRCPVFELAPSSAVSEGNVDKFDLRAGSSVDKNGKPDGTGTGMGWFPGYVIDVETGERLNVAFGENSFLESENGRDMIWNPTSTYTTAPDGFGTEADFAGGGMHSIYIFGAHDNVPSYDEGEYVYNELTTGTSIDIRNTIKNITWVYGFPMLTKGQTLLSSNVTIQLRVSKTYESESNKLPEYTFNTADIKAQFDDEDAAKISLDDINVVPNPYYGYSEYEKAQLDKVVKIVNVPDKAKIRIFTLNGTLVRTIEKDDPTITSVEWNLENDAGVPIASGLYIIHVEVDGVGEKILKWFGAMRPIDLDTF